VFRSEHRITRLFLKKKRTNERRKKNVDYVTVRKKFMAFATASAGKPASSSYTLLLLLLLYVHDLFRPTATRACICARCGIVLLLLFSLGQPPPPPPSPRIVGPRGDDNKSLKLKRAVKQFVCTPCTYVNMHAPTAFKRVINTVSKVRTL